MPQIANLSNVEVITVGQVKAVSEKFHYRPLVVIDRDSNPMRPEAFEVQVMSHDYARLDQIQVGDRVNVEVALQGRETAGSDGAKRYFMSMFFRDCVLVRRSSQAVVAQPAPAPYVPAPAPAPAAYPGATTGAPVHTATTTTTSTTASAVADASPDVDDLPFF